MHFRTPSLLLLILSVCLPAVAMAQDSRVSASLRSGVEIDDNVDRVEGFDRDADFLTRYLGSVDMLARAGAGVISVEASHGGKVFLERSDADVIVTQLGLGWSSVLLGPMGGWLQLDGKDVTERVHRRDYQRAGASAGLSLRAQNLLLRAGVSSRYFAYKPNPSVGSTSVDGLIAASYRLGDFQLSASYAQATRSFEIFALRRQQDVIITSIEQREDRYHDIRLGAGYRGVVVADLTFHTAFNRSNSYGQNITRYGGEFRLTAPIVANFFASARIEIQRTGYEDPVLLDESFVLDEENRNALVGSLTWVFWRTWELEARYSIYLQEFGVGGQYRRQTAAMLVGFHWD